MNVRSASFRDLARVEQLYRDALDADLGVPGLHPDSPVPQATLLRLWYALSKTLSSLVPLNDTGGVLFVAEDDSEGVVGFIQAQATSTRPSVWQIINFCVAPGGAGHFARERLLTHLCNRGLEQHVHRYHVRLPLDHPLVGVFLAFLVSAAFHAYAIWVGLGFFAGVAMTAWTFAYFVAQALVMLVEQPLGVRKWPSVAGHVWTVTWMLALAPMFVEPVLRLLGL